MCWALFIGLSAQTTVCSPDTVRYPDAKASGYTEILLDSLSGLRAMAQFYPAPDSITVYGFEFFARSTGDTAVISAELYLAGIDSLPTGAPLAVDSVSILPGAFTGNLNDRRYLATFATPVTVGQNWLLILRNRSGEQVQVTANDNVASDGDGDWLANVKTPTGWKRGYQISHNLFPFNADFLFQPIVSYSVQAVIDPNVYCLPDSETVYFGNNSSDIFLSPFYNQSAFYNRPDSSFTWNYGDGSPEENASDPVHFYAAMGPYTVTLKDTIFGWTRNCAADTFFVIEQGSPAGFEYTAALLNVQFSDTSLGNPILWLWDFGDGNTSTVQDPIHNYSTPGTYTVCLTVVDTCNIDSACKIINLNCTPPAAAFGDSISNLIVYFSDSSVSGNTLGSWLWDFGDGNTSTNQHPNHTYGSPGTYTVCLYVQDSCGADTLCQSLTVNCTPPSASFSATPGSLQAQFSNTSTMGGGIQYLWNFGDGNTSTAINPTHNYAASGTYTVCLIAFDGCGADTTCQPVTISCTVPVVNYSYSLSALTATFTNLSTSAFSTPAYLWDFGDGQTSTLQNPTHVYDTAGTYTVCLTVSDSCNTSQSCQTLNVVCNPPNSSFFIATNLLTANFTDATSSSQTVTYRMWYFGDGNTSTAQNPSHTYATAGTYTVCLVTESICGRDSACQLVTVNCPAANAFFVTTVFGLDVDFSDLSTGSGISAWSWEFGDGNTSTLQNPSHTYAMPGSYQACLEVTDSCGTDRICRTVIVDTLTSVADPAMFNAILYPSPANETVYFSANTSGEWFLAIHDLSGRMMFRKSGLGMNAEEEIRVNEWPNGVYLLDFRSGNDFLRGKIVVQH